MKLAETLELHTKAPKKLKRTKATAAGGQGGSSQLGRQYAVVLNRESDGVSQGKLGTTNTRVVHRTKIADQAEKMSQAMPYTKVVSAPLPEETIKLRDIARKRLVRTNPDVD